MGGAAPSPDAKRPRLSGEPSAHNRELAHLVAVCDSSLPFVCMRHELSAMDIPHQGLQVEGDNTTLAIRLLKIPPCMEVGVEARGELERSLLDCTMRLQGRNNRTWLVELAFTGCPVHSTSPREQGPVRRVYLTYESPPAQPAGSRRVLHAFLDDWRSISRLYSCVLDFSHTLHETTIHFSQFAEVRTYTYKKLVLCYGPNKGSSNANKQHPLIIFPSSLTLIPVFLIHVFLIPVFLIHVFLTHVFMMYVFQVHVFLIHVFLTHAFMTHAFLIYVFLTHVFLIHTREGATRSQ
ncbi:mediator of RNA polymerase II transcription subunit 14 [Lethenteron reissneri]|uniref:mediator of RNA polymerase II transcription subunit 14 n=1 Tax=Lethenteron reissneri TaxID=7753 RepID=UPI002AB6A5F4|nr:mediator of RNA polymerase II transcription subunit 14 [Lethenteron reissneri]